MGLFNADIFNNEIFNTGEVALVTIRGHKRRRRSKPIDWSLLEKCSIEKCTQQEIEAKAVEIIQEEIRIEKEKKTTEHTISVVKQEWKLKGLQNQIKEIEREQSFLHRQKKLILAEIKRLKEEDEEMATILMLL